MLKRRRGDRYSSCQRRHGCSVLFSSRICLICGLLLMLLCLFSTSAAFTPAHVFTLRRVEGLPKRLYDQADINADNPGSRKDSDDNDDDDDDDDYELIMNKPDKRLSVGGIFSKSASGVKELAQKGGSNVKSAASTGVKSVADAAKNAFGLTNLVKKGASDVKSAAGMATSGLSSGLTGLAEKGTSDVKSAAGMATSGLSGLTVLAGKGTSSVKSAASMATSGLRSGLTGLAEKGTSDAKSAAGMATSGLNGLTELAGKGTSEVKSAAGMAAAGLGGLAKRGSSDVSSAASAAGTSLTGVVERGTSDAVNVAQWLDAQAKGGASVANSQARAFVLGFTGKSDYQVGDIAKEVIRRARTSSSSLGDSDYNIQDVMLLLKVLVTVGATVTPLAKMLPVKVLLDMLNVSLEARLGGKLLEVLAGSLDQRFSAAFSADELGDLAKRLLSGSIAKFTEKETYETGDIERAALKAQQQQEDKSGASAATISTGDSDSLNSGVVPTKTFELSVGPEFQEWDEAFRESHPEDWELAVATSLQQAGPKAASKQTSMSPKALDMEIVSELEEWDKMFREKYPDAN